MITIITIIISLNKTIHDDDDDDDDHHHHHHYHHFSVKSNFYKINFSMKESIFRLTVCGS